MPIQPEASGRGLLVPLPAAGGSGLPPHFTRYLGTTYQTFLTVAQRLPPSLAHLQPAVRRVIEATQSAARRNPRGVVSCFASPTVGSAIHCLGLRDDLPAFQARIDAGLLGAIPNLLLELCARRLLSDGEMVEWPEPVARLASLSLGAVISPPAAATRLRFHNGHLSALAGDETLAEVALDGAALAALAAAPDTFASAASATANDVASDGKNRFRVAPGYRRVGKVTRFAEIDHNPIAQFEAHPDKAGNTIDLGDHPASEWAATLDEAFALIERYAAPVFGEMGMMLHEVIPVGYHRERHLSASYREAIGTVYLTLHPNVMTMAEALIHEFQHNKLNAASYSAELLENAFYPLYPSPVRPDPRPLWGILLAAHAFLPVAQLYRSMRAADHPRARQPDFPRRLSEIDLKNHEAMEMLRAHAHPTRVGRQLMDEMFALDAAHMSERAASGLTLAPTEVHLS